MRVLVVLLLLLISAPALGQPASSSTDEALRRAYEADELFAAARWDEAYEGFAAAEAIAHSPVFVIYMGHCRRNAGRLLEAEALYQRVIGEELAADAPKPFRAAQSDARREQMVLGGRIPSLRVRVRGATGPVSLFIDGKPAVVAAITRVDPGGHEVEARSGDQTVRQTINVPEGGDPHDVPLTLSPTVDAVEDDGSYVPAIVALSIGGAALVVGTITGALAASKASEIDDGCVDGHCLVEDADDLDTAQTLATISTAAFIVGAVGVVAGGVLLFVRPGGSSGSAMLEARIAF